MKKLLSLISMGVMLSMSAGAMFAAGAGTSCGQGSTDCPFSTSNSNSPSVEGDDVGSY